MHTWAHRRARRDAHTNTPTHTLSPAGQPSVMWGLLYWDSMMKCVGTSGERKVLPGQWCVTGDIREVVPGQPSLTATTLLDMGAGAVLSRHGSAEAEDVSVHHLSVCHTHDNFFFACACICVWMNSVSSLPLRLPDSSQSSADHPGGPTRTRVDVLEQRAGNLNLHTLWLQLPDLLPQEPRLLLHALFPHPAEH